MQAGMLLCSVSEASPENDGVEKYSFTGEDFQVIKQLTDQSIAL